MAMKYYCDGCDKEVAYDFIKLVNISVKPRGQVTSVEGEYELCKGCFDTVCRDSNPKNWARCAPPARRMGL